MLCLLIYLIEEAEREGERKQDEEPIIILWFSPQMHMVAKLNPIRTGTRAPGPSPAASQGSHRQEAVIRTQSPNSNEGTWIWDVCVLICTPQPLVLTPAFLMFYRFLSSFPPSLSSFLPPFLPCFIFFFLFLIPLPLYKKPKFPVLHMC